MEYESENRIDSTGSLRVCQNCKKDFVIEPEDFNFYEKIKVPPPTFCPECRSIRRMIWRNERALYKKDCFLCKKNVISLYAKNSNIKILCQNCWWSDDWDPLDFSKKVDFSRVFYLKLEIYF